MLDEAHPRRGFSRREGSSADFRTLVPDEARFLPDKIAIFSLFSSFTLSSPHSDDRSKERAPHFSACLLLSRCVSRGLWKPINGGQAIQDQVLQTQIPITITQPFLDRGQLSLGTFITGALATGGLVTGIITQFVTTGLEQFGKKRDKGEVAQPKAESATPLPGADKGRRDKSGPTFHPEG